MSKRSSSVKPGGRTLMSEDDRNKIVRRIAQLTLSEKPSWQTVIDIAAAVTKQEYTRQGLHRIGQIKDAFDLRLAQHKNFLICGIKPAAAKLPEEVDPKDLLIQNLRGDIAKRDETIRLQDQRLIRLVASASSRGLDIALLDQDLDKPERNSTDTNQRR